MSTHEAYSTPAGPVPKRADADILTDRPSIGSPVDAVVRFIRLLQDGGCGSATVADGARPLGAAIDRDAEGMRKIQ